MLILSKAPLFLWVEAVATAFYTQNRSLIRKCYNKTSYELLHDRKPNLSYLHVFGALCYPTNDGEDLGKLKPKADIGIFIGYAPAKKAFRIYNKRTRMIIETIHVDFDELTAMAFEQFSSRPGPKLLTPRTIIVAVIAPEPAVSTGTPSSTTIDQDAPSSSTSQTTQETPPSNLVLKNPLLSDPSRPVSTRHQLQDEALFCYFDAFLSSVEPKSYKEALTESYCIEAMQEELNEFELLEV
ncbi:retrovirus-related pol polyprotein from transposon TNT 1-94 [Tanacetum coccineum]